MNVNRRSQADRSAATRAALVAAARPLFAARGFGGVGTQEIVAAAGVTRGALYHQFADKTELFAAVFEAVETEVTERLATAVVEAGAEDPLDALAIGVRLWLEVCSEPEVHRIILVEAPSVLGHARWREIGLRHALGLVETELQMAMDAGRLRAQPLRPLAHVLIGALDEAALYVAGADDRDGARAEATATLQGIITALAP